MSGANLSFDELLHSSSSEAGEEGRSLLGVSLLEAQQDRRKTFSERNELLTLRAALKKEILELRLQLLKLRVKIAREEVLHQQQKQGQNDDNTLQTNGETSSSSDKKRLLNEEEVGWDLLQALELSKALPSQDLAKRMQYVLLLCPCLEVFDAQEIEHPDSGRVISFTIQASGETAGVIFRCKVEVTVDEIDGDDVVLLIAFPNRAETVTLSMLSLSYYSLVVKNYLPNKKLNLLMYSFNSLAELVEKRLIAFSAVTNPTSLEVTTSTVVIPCGDRQIRILWLLILADTVTGELESQIQASLVDLMGNLSDISLMFSMLLRETSLKEAVEVVSKNYTN